MKLTADTITDEQIRELLLEAESIDKRWKWLADICNIALRVRPSCRCCRCSDWRQKRSDARARCAEILNARNEVK